MHPFPEDWFTPGNEKYPKGRWRSMGWEGVWSWIQVEAWWEGGD